MTDERKGCGVSTGSLKRAVERIIYIAEQAVRMLLSASVAFAAGYLSFDWMTVTFDPMSAIFVLMLIIGFGGCAVYLALDKLTVRRRDR